MSILVNHNLHLHCPVNNDSFFWNTGNNKVSQLWALILSNFSTADATHTCMFMRTITRTRTLEHKWKWQYQCTAIFLFAANISKHTYTECGKKGANDDGVRADCMGIEKRLLVILNFFARSNYLVQMLDILVSQYSSGDSGVEKRALEWDVMLCYVMSLSLSTLTWNRNVCDVSLPLSPRGLVHHWNRFLSIYLCILPSILLRRVCVYVCVWMDCKRIRDEEERAKQNSAGSMGHDDEKIHITFWAFSIRSRSS